MKVTLEKHGGMAAIRHPPVTIDAAELNEYERSELEQLIHQVQREAPRSQASPDRMRDAMSYRISVDEGGQTADYRQSDINMSEAFARLMDWLQRHRSGHSP